MADRSAPRHNRRRAPTSRWLIATTGILAAVGILLLGGGSDRPVHAARADGCLDTPGRNHCQDGVGDLAVIGVVVGRLGLLEPPGGATVRTAAPQPRAED
jgi:hypothetical protein